MRVTTSHSPCCYVCGSSYRSTNHCAKPPPAARLLRLSVILAIASIALDPIARATAQGACEVASQGRARIDCLIGRARIATQKSDIAREKARLGSNTAIL